MSMGFPGRSADKEPICSAGDLGLIHGLGRSHGRGHGIPLQYSCLENSMDRGAWWAYSPWGRKESDTTEWACTHNTSKETKGVNMRRLTELRVLLSGQSGQAQILGLFPVDYGNTRLCSVLSQKELSKVHCPEQHQQLRRYMHIQDRFWRLFPKFTMEHLQSKVC